MFDFLGFIPTSESAPSPDLTTGLETYRNVLGIDFQVTNEKVGSLQYWALSHPGDQVDQFEGQRYFLQISGEVYWRHDFGGQRILAAEFAEKYRNNPTEILNQIKGNFNLKIVDKETDQYTFISDQLSLQSFYYRQTPNGFFFASSLWLLKHLLTLQGEEVKIDQTSVLEYYLFDFTLNDHTMVEGVKELQAGRMLSLHQGSLTESIYSDPFVLFPLTGEQLSEKEGGALLTETLGKNVTSFTDGPHQTALALTGGYDSRSIAALTGEDFARYQYYSYGYPESWDIKIPRMLAKKNSLAYQVIDLSGAFRHQFAKYAQKAIEMGDGIAEANRANYVYVYANHLEEKRSIISGLFGSELIKTPSSRGLFVDENILDILRADDPKAALDTLLQKTAESNQFEQNKLKEVSQALRERVLNNPFMVNDLPIAQKLFYFILMIGARKYFAKELKLERFYIRNKMPFFDIDFIQVLLKTPFPWVYNWSAEKNLLKNLKIHKVYANFVSQNKGLMNTISTHGFEPRFLRSKFYYPLLALQFYRTKKQISRESRLAFDDELRSFLTVDDPSIENTDAFFLGIQNGDFKNFIKMHSLNRWMRFMNI